MSLDPETTLQGACLFAWLDYARHLKGANRSPRTIQGYGEAVAQLAGYITRHADPEADPPVTFLTADKRIITDYLIWCREEHSAATALNRYRSLRACYGWLEADEAITRSPMIRVPAPSPGQKMPAVLEDRELSALLKVCSGKRHADLRDRAVIGLWCEAGSPRLSEMAGIGLSDLDMRHDRVLIRGKGDKERLVPMSPETARDVSRYLRMRAGHRDAALSAAWLGERGAMRPRGMAQMLSDRAVAAGIGHVHPHQLRHTAYHRFRLAGGSVDDAMVLFGWAVIEMALIYGRDAAASRSVSAGQAIAVRSGL